MAYRVKDPAAINVYGWDWSPWLADDSTLGTQLITSDWSATPPTGITLTDLEHESNVTKVQVEGGTLGQTYRLTNHVTTDGGDEDDRSHIIRIAER